MPRLCLIDYGAGNLHSAARGLERAGAEGHWQLQITNNPEDIQHADRLVLPGVGAFKSCADGLRAHDGLEAAIQHFVTELERPFLGICVGMQLLAERGLEHGETKGLGFIPGTVAEMETGVLRKPHMGWNEVIAKARHPILPRDRDAYFVHSYVLLPDDQSNVIATCEYGGAFPAAVAKNNIAGAQFHPEKSGAYGQEFLSRFLEWKP